MKSYAVCQCGAPLEPREEPTPNPTGTEVLLRVLAALDRSLDRAVVTDDGETRAAAGGGLWW